MAVDHNKYKGGMESGMNKAVNRFKKIVDKIIPIYAIIPLLFSFGLGTALYRIIMSNGGSWYHYNFQTSLDEKIPVMSIWMYVYFGCYLFWAVNYIITARVYRDDSDMFYKFIFADILARIICSMIFIVVPTTIKRPKIQINTFSDRLLAYLYTIDEPTNLFPSMHCLYSWMSFAGVRHSRKVPKWYKIFSFIFAVMVAASTQFTKQHYLVDIAGGFLLGELSYQISLYSAGYKVPQKLFTWINVRLFGRDRVYVKSNGNKI